MAGSSVGDAIQVTEASKARQSLYLHAKHVGNRMEKAGFYKNRPFDIATFIKSDVDAFSALQVGVSADNMVQKQEMEAIYGDIIFSALNLGRHFNLDPEKALRQTLTKMEKVLNTVYLLSKKPVEQSTPEELNLLWIKAKRLLKHEQGALRA